jgi:L-threonylcarbamoyladenylate synthase
MPPEAEIKDAVAVLRDGRLVAFPTETVYGLGADATNPDALRRLFGVKDRPSEHPVIVHLADPAMVDDWARDVPDAAHRLAEACWPGPLTLVLRRRPCVRDEITGGLETVGLRVPGHTVALELLRAFGGGLAAPSANRFGQVSPTTAEHVRADLGGDVDLVLDGGPCTVGVESTIVDCSGDALAVLRPGGVSADRLTELIGHAVPTRVPGAVRAPGTLASHYAPRALVMVVGHTDVVVRAGALLAEGRRVGVLAPAPPFESSNLPDRLVVLDPPSSAEEYARVLYRRLREADRLGLDVLLAVPPAEEGIGAAVADRLRRAGGPSR